MDRIVGRLFRRYALAGVLISGGVAAGFVLAQRQHLEQFPAREAEPVPCIEACQKRASCGGAADVARCATLCNADARETPAEALREARCMLEQGCAELASCGGRW